MLRIHTSRVLACDIVGNIRTGEYPPDGSLAQGGGAFKTKYAPLGMGNRFKQTKTQSPQSRRERKGKGMSRK
jgi:hypothetical protein